MGYGVIHFNSPCGGPALDAISLASYRDKRKGKSEAQSCDPKVVKEVP